MQRLVHRLAERPNRVIAETLGSLAVAELIHPGKRFILVSPWISNFPIIDNRDGAFSGLDGTWSATKIRLSDFLRALLRRGVAVYLACGDDATAVDFVQRLQAGARQDGVEALLTVRVSQLDSARPLEHEKALIAETWALHGSMNLTYRGVEVNGELVTISSDVGHVADLATTMMELFR
jgi:hypothetical protein